MGEPSAPAPTAPKPETAAKPTKPAETLKVVNAAEAAPLLDGLKKVSKVKNLADAWPAFDALAGLTHPEFEPALAKHLGHSLREVAIRSATEIGKRPSPTTAATLWKGWMLSVNDRRPDVRGAVLSAMGAAGLKLDSKQYVEVESLFRKAADAPSLVAVAGYFKTIATDKRPCRLLAEWLDEPVAGGKIEDGSNPPAEWWQARWNMWNAVKPVAVDALQAITGQRFVATEEAKTWFAKNPKFGFTW
jgi:hypothetical protein